MHTLELGTFMYRNSVNELPSSFNNYFTKRSEVHSHLTRHGNHLSLTKNKKTFHDFRLILFVLVVLGPRLWNPLENLLRASKSVKQFRNQLKQKLISSYDLCLSAVPCLGKYLFVCFLTSFVVLFLLLGLKLGEGYYQAFLPFKPSPHYHLVYCCIHVFFFFL